MLPLLAGNWEPTIQQCLFGAHFHSVVTEATGFTYLNEGTERRPKWGYVGNTTGAVLRLRINTQVSKDYPDEPATVQIGHLRSYTSIMGSAEVK